MTADAEAAEVAGSSTASAASPPSPTDSAGPGGSRRAVPGRFLPLPGPLEAPSRRMHRIVIALLMLVGLAQGTYWTVTTVAWSPIDEVAHFGYVESLATGQGIPTVGIDLLEDETLASVKETPTLWFRSNPYQPVASDGNWGGTRHQYEAIHGPTYYAAMVPAYWIGQPLGVGGSLYAVRIATALLVVASIPLTWMLARRLFPDRPMVWLLAPALLVVVNSLSGGVVSNDAMALLLSIAATVMFLRALDEHRNWFPSVAAGALFGLTILTKMTSLMLIPFLAIAFVAWVVTRRPGLAAPARFVARFMVGAVAAFGPWLAFNLRLYQAPSGAAVVDSITGSVLPGSEFGVEAIVGHAEVARPGVWLSPLVYDLRYQRLWEVALVVALVLGGAVAARRRQWRDLAILLWCGSALPLAFFSMEAIVFVLFDGTGGPMGRHLIVALTPSLVMVAAATVIVVGSRWAPPVVGALVAASLILQVPLAHGFIEGFYLPTSLDDRLAPAVYQDWSDAVRTDQPTIRFDATCTVEAIGIGFSATVPDEFIVRGPDGSVRAFGGGEIHSIPTYRLETPITGPFTVEIPEDGAVRWTVEDRSEGMSFATVEGDPVATSYCANPDPDQRAFELIYPVGHPDEVSLGMLRAAPIALAVAGVLVALGLAVNAARPRRSRPTADSPLRAPVE